MSLRIINWPDFLKGHVPGNLRSAMTIGVFDGVHIGHSALIARVVRRGPNPTVVTFRENPKKIVSGTYEGDIYSLKQKLEVFAGLGVKRVVLIDFSAEFSKLKGPEFIELLEKQGKMAFLAIGNNFRCGFRQDADALRIRDINEGKGIPTEIVPQVTFSVNPNEPAEPVSSSRLRSALLSGDLEQAATLMGRNFSLDLSDMSPVFSGSSERENRHVYDPGSVSRIVPPEGRYPVLLYPGALVCRADIKNGKVFLPFQAESLEFINPNLGAI